MEPPAGSVSGWGFHKIVASVIFIKKEINAFNKILHYFNCIKHPSQECRACVPCILVKDALYS